jgi:hypothetical protein
MVLKLSLPSIVAMTGLTTTTASASFLCLIPQNTAHSRSPEFTKCVNSSGIGWMLVDQHFSERNASFVNRVSDAEGVDAGLLGFTFYHEGGFNMDSGPNTNGLKDPHEWDWGPFGLNYNQTIRDMNKGSYSIEGLDIHAVFGDLGGWAGNTPLDPMQNARLGARKLAYLLKASNYDYATAAGRYKSWKGDIFRGRRDEWRQEGGQFQAFFSCWTDR